MTHTNGFVSIPSSAFSGVSDGGNLGFHANESGTARHFNVKMFAPVSLPDGATVTSMRCGGTSSFKRQIAFILRRNDPQQANVDMATVRSSLDGTGFEFVDTNSISSASVDNGRFNYYLVAKIEDPSVTPPTVPFGPNDANGVPVCSVGFCRIGYRTDNSPLIGS